MKRPLVPTLPLARSLLLLGAVSACSRTPDGTGQKGAGATGPSGGATDGGEGDGGDSGGRDSSPGTPTDSGGAEGDSGPADPGPDTGSSWTMPSRPDTDHPGLNDAWRWGGGAGYPDMVDPTWPVVTRVSDLAGLEAALAAATVGDVVFVEDSASIDLTGLSLCIPSGVWLAGGRGQSGSPGGLLYSTLGASDALLSACGDAVRITGLRIRGPDPETCPPEWPSDCPNDVSGDSNCAYCTDTANAIGAIGFDDLEVDNNELSGWTYAGVKVKDALNADVHHNHIHHGWREGLGYGVVLYGSSATTALIRWNRFDAMRHAVAGQGYPDEDYEARDNLMGDSAIGHIFDMHGENEAADDGSPNAGGDIRVHENIVLVSDEYSFVIRGRPSVGAWFYDNCVAPSSDEASLQRYYTGNFYIDLAPDGSSAPNAYSQSASGCGTLRWCLADRVVGPIRYGSASGTAAASLLVGDMDGDGRDDVFGSDGSAWRWANPDGGTWATLATTTTPVSSVALADLDGDGIDDVFSATGSVWRWSRSGNSSWATLQSSTYTQDEVGFGDFDGDGRMDVFTTDGHRWSYSPGGSGAAVSLASSSVSISQLAFGDLDGDGITDVFRADGSQWHWSRSGTSTWADLASSSLLVDDLRLVDVDGDHKADVVGRSGSSLVYSSAGTTSWITLRHAVEGLDDLQLGDWDGDGRVDLLTGGCL